MTTNTDTTNDQAYNFDAWCSHEDAADIAESFWDYAGQFVHDRQTPMPWSFWDELYEAWNS